MKIMWHGVPACYPTGYGQQTRLWTRTLQDEGHDVIISSVIPVMPTHTDQQGFRTLSCGPRDKNIGNDMIQAHVRQHNPDLVISMLDTFIMDSEKFKDLPWAAWQVIDSAPLLDEINEKTGDAKHLLAMSDFGARTLAEAGLVPHYVPLGIDTDEFSPMPSQQAREDMAFFLGRPLKKQEFFVVMNAANMSRPSRKNFSGAFQAFKNFKDESGATALLYCHTEATGKMQGGIDLVRVAEAVGLKDGDLAFPPQYEYNTGVLPETYLRIMYSAADVFLHPAKGEGFCLPLVEAQACGCPVITSRFSSMPEVSDPQSGFLVGGHEYMHYEGTYWLQPDVDEVTNGLWQAWQRMKQAGHHKSEKAVDFAQKYDIRTVYQNHFLPFLNSIGY